MKFILLICSLIFLNYENRVVEVRAYCLCEQCTSKELAKIPKENRRTANGNFVFKDNVFQKGLAVPKNGLIVYGSTVWIPEYGEVTADDTGSWMNSKWTENRELYVEVRFENHQEALDWGVKKLRIFWKK